MGVSVATYPAQSHPHQGSRIGRVRLRLHHDASSLPPEVPDAEDLARSLAQALKDLGQRDDDSYWVVRRLALQFPTDPRLTASGLSDAFARAMKDALTRVLAGQIVEGVRRYESRAWWLAEALWCAGAGRLSNAWQFARFRHLAPLPPGDQVRLSLVGEGEVAFEAIAILARDGRLAELAHRMGERAVRGTLVVLLDPTGAPVLRDVPEALAEAISSFGREQALGPHSAILCALAEYRSRNPGLPLPSLRTLERATPDPGGTPSLRPPTRAFAQSDPVGINQTAPLPEIERAGNPQFGETQAARSGGFLALREPAYLETRFAGVFALWRSVTEMGLLSLLPQDDGAGACRLALAAALAGPDHEEAARDPALHWLTGYDPEDKPLPAPPPGLVADFLAHYRDWRMPRRIEPTICKIGRSHLLQDAATEDWLALGPRRDLLKLASALPQPSPPRPDARDPTNDARWFAVANRAARRPWAILARAAFGDFARRLHGLERASAHWCWTKLLAGTGRLDFLETPTITLPQAELDIVLRMSAINGCRLRTTEGDLVIRLPEAGHAT